MQMARSNAQGSHLAPIRGDCALSWWWCLIALLATVASGRAALQFDVFLGYEGTVREAAWFPVACEISNDGPSFNAVVELTAGSLGTDQVRRVPIELPTNTRKRFVIPVFAAGGRFYQWNARLLDERGKVREERPALQPKIVPWEGYLLGQSQGRLPASQPCLTGATDLTSSPKSPACKWSNSRITPSRWKVWMLFI